MTKILSGRVDVIMHLIETYVFLPFSFFDAIGVMWAIGGTALVTLGLSLFALQTKVSTHSKCAPLAFENVPLGQLKIMYGLIYLHYFYAFLTETEGKSQNIVCVAGDTCLDVSRAQSPRAFPEL